jgi:hypothetical protein
MAGSGTGTGNEADRGPAREDYPRLGAADQPGAATARVPTHDTDGVVVDGIKFATAYALDRCQRLVLGLPFGAAIVTVIGTEDAGPLGGRCDLSDDTPLVDSRWTSTMER